MSKKKLGVHSEAGKLHKVMVCSPGLAHLRLTPNNCDELLFDDVIWVSQAKRDHFDFMTKMRERGVDVVEMHNLLEETIKNPEALKWILDRKITANSVGLGLQSEVRSFIESLESRRIAEFLIGGVSGADLVKYKESEVAKMFCAYQGESSFLFPPLPNTQFTRDTTCWIYGGVTLNPMYWPARRQETLLTTAIYKFHPDFINEEFEIWYGDPDQDHGSATLEGGDVMPIGNGTVLIGMGERSSHQAIGQVAKALFDKGAADKVVVAGLGKSRAAMHLDTVFSFCDRDLVTVFPEVAYNIVPFVLRPDESKPGGIDVRRHIVVQLLVGPGEAPSLLQAVAHARPGFCMERGTKGVASLRGSASEASDSATKLTGRSGLSRAARPTLAQYSICPAMVRCSLTASERA